jgi:anti-sigma regulatory factor (Ser/Thr protein kinase)
VIGVDDLPVARAHARRHAEAAGMSELKCDDLALSVTEIAANSIRHGGGAGVLRVWRDGGALVCEVRDAGRFEHPLAGRFPPPAGHDGGYGLWLVNQVCDLVQLRTFPTGNVVRIHMRI